MNFFQLLKTMFKPSPQLAPKACVDRVRRGDAVLVDVRDADEWADGVAQDAHLLSLGDLTEERTVWRPFLEKMADREILLYCASGGRSGMAASILAAEGYRVANTGGLSDWARAGWPIVKPQPIT